MVPEYRRIFEFPDGHFPRSRRVAVRRGSSSRSSHRFLALRGQARQHQVAFELGPNRGTAQRVEDERQFPAPSHRLRLISDSILPSRLRCGGWAMGGSLQEPFRALPGTFQGALRTPSGCSVLGGSPGAPGGLQVDPWGCHPLGLSSTVQVYRVW